MAKIYTVRVLKDLGEFKTGAKVRVNDNDRVWGHYWRRRLKDAATDGCCELVPEKTPKPTKKAKALEDSHDAGF